jgi:hypothetical protein
MPLHAYTAWYILIQRVNFLKRSMMSNTLLINAYDEITQVIHHYIDGARAGKGSLMKPAFHDDATIFGYVGDDLFAGPIQGLYDWNDANGPAPNIVTRIVSIDVVETIASARVESDNWTGIRFTDFFNLLKVDGQWKIMNKIFHTHA